MAVQFLWVRLMCVREKARGMNAGWRGSYWRATHSGHTQSRLCWMTLLLMKPRACNTNPARKSSSGATVWAGWETALNRARMAMGSRNPRLRATVRTIYFHGSHLSHMPASREPAREEIPFRRGTRRCLFRPEIEVRHHRQVIRGHDRQWEGRHVDCHRLQPAVHQDMIQARDRKPGEPGIAWPTATRLELAVGKMARQFTIGKGVRPAIQVPAQDGGHIRRHSPQPAFPQQALRLRQLFRGAQTEMGVQDVDGHAVHVHFHPQRSAGFRIPSARRAREAAGPDHLDGKAAENGIAELRVFRFADGMEMIPKAQQ